MFLRSLRLTNFKCYTQAQVSFSENTICIHGLNGSGKTNLLDAIHFICIGKSYFNPVDKQNIRHGESFFRIEAEIKTGEELFEVVCINENGRRKKVKVNDVVHSKLSDHIGQFPVVVIAPDDVELIMGGSEERRRFMDFILSFTDRPYLEALTKYNKVLQQRNSLLKKAGETGNLDEYLLYSYDVQLSEPGNYIFEQRKAFAENFNPLFLNHYKVISHDAEVPELSYQSHLHEDDIKGLMKSSRRKDEILQRTTKGIHKDDLLFTLSGEELKKYGSQGQKKSFLVALKLAQYQFLESYLKKKPILLLDDIFDKLDDNRSRELIDMVSSEKFGQVFITDTSEDRLRDIFKDANKSFDIFEVSEATIVKDGR